MTMRVLQTYQGSGASITHSPSEKTSANYPTSTSERVNSDNSKQLDTHVLIPLITYAQFGCFDGPAM